MTLLAALALRSLLTLPDPEMLFMLAVMLTAVRFGRGPSALSATLSVACYDFFFVPPLYTFTVADRQYMLTFATMFVVSFLLSELASRLKRQEREAVSREEGTAVLYALSRDLAAVDDPVRIAKLAARHAAQVFAARAAILQLDAEGALRVIGTEPPNTTLEAKDFGVAKWALEHSELAGLGTDTLPGSASICAPLRIAGVDEAGRGPLAGPVVCAAVILKPRFRLPGLDDSKVLCEQDRERLFPPSTFDHKNT